MIREYSDILIKQKHWFREHISGDRCNKRQKVKNKNTRRAQVVPNRMAEFVVFVGRITSHKPSGFVGCFAEHKHI
jgi:hypothetical protein